MKVILLEKVHNLGNLGDEVNVKPGYGRNFLIPHGKATPATAANRAVFEERRAELEKKEKDNMSSAQKRVEQLEKLAVVMLTAKVHDENKLFGSVGVREIADAIAAKGVAVEKREINLPNGPIHEIGEYPVELILHGDIRVTISVKVDPEQ